MLRWTRLAVVPKKRRDCGRSFEIYPHFSVSQHLSYPPVYSWGMKRSWIETKALEQEEVTSFGGAVLLRDANGRLEIVGGTEEERREAIEWATKFLLDRSELRWYSKAHTRRIKLPRLPEGKRPSLN